MGRGQMTNVYTIGHSNDSLEHFLDLLKQHEITALVDIRRFPSSRKFPHFNESNLSRALQENGIEYHWLESLGGRRPEAKDPPSQNTGLRNQSFPNT